MAASAAAAASSPGSRFEYVSSTFDLLGRGDRAGDRASRTEAYLRGRSSSRCGMVDTTFEPWDRLRDGSRRWLASAGRRAASGPWAADAAHRRTRATRVLRRLALAGAGLFSTAARPRPLRPGDAARRGAGRGADPAAALRGAHDPGAHDRRPRGERPTRCWPSTTRSAGASPTRGRRRRRRPRSGTAGSPCTRLWVDPGARPRVRVPVGRSGTTPGGPIDVVLARRLRARCPEPGRR